jgi:hypothetical protein
MAGQIADGGLPSLLAHGHEQKLWAAFAAGDGHANYGRIAATSGCRRLAYARPWYKLKVPCRWTSLMELMRFFRACYTAMLGIAPRAAGGPLLEPDRRSSARAAPVSALPGVENPATFWPASLAHVAFPHDTAGSEYITIAEISEAHVGGFEGYRKVTVALVPLAMVSEILQSTAATGHEIQSHGPLPIVDDVGPPHRSGFWIAGIERENRFEPLVNAWRGSDTDVLVPDNNLLMVFGLVPRHTGESQLSWDDLHGPVYDVVRTSTVSDYQRPKDQRQRAFVEIRRDYLLEYCRIKQAAAVAFYYEQRWSRGDATFDRVMAGRSNEDFYLPGRLLNLQSHRSHVDGSPRQFAQVWGRRIVMPRGERRVIEVDDPALVWPDHAEPMTLQRAGSEHLMAYVSDQVLRDYEGRPAFEIHPKSGGVSYRAQWSVGYCHRTGREHIALELKKLYEGSPSAVIEHWHRYAVPQAQAYADRDINGDRNIAIRAEELVAAYLAMTRTLAQLADRLGLSFAQADVGSHDIAGVECRGWWTIEGLSSLGNVVPLSVALDGFLDRAVTVVILLESIHQAPLRNMVLKLGTDKKQVAEFKSMKLLATLCQLATICRGSGHRWPEDASHIVGGWNKDLRIPFLRRLFAVNQLRQKASHRTGADFAASLAADLDAFGIEPMAQAAGWGRAVDAMYDGLIEDFNAIATLLSAAD